MTNKQSDKKLRPRQINKETNRQRDKKIETKRGAGKKQ